MRCYLKLVKPEIPNFEDKQTAPDFVMPYQDEERIKRSIELPRHVWTLIENDAKRTHRSVNGMVSALLFLVYFDADVNIHGAERARVVSPSAMEMESEHRQRKAG
jgi:hypothetical protein